MERKETLATVDAENSGFRNSQSAIQDGTVLADQSTQLKDDMKSHWKPLKVL